MRAPLAALLLASALLAGCAGAPAATVAPPAPYVGDELGLQVGAVPAAHQPTTLLLAGAASPNGTLTAYRWSVPDAAITTDDWGSRSIVLDILPVVAEGAAWPDAYALYAFAPNGGVLELRMGLLNEPLEDMGGGLLGTTGPMPATFEPLRARMADPEGEPLTLVLAARGEAAPFGLLVRAGADGNRPSGALEDYAEPSALEPIGTGEGHTAAIYLDVTLLAGLAAIHVRSADATVEERLDPTLRGAVSLRDTSIRSAHGPGWSYGLGVYLGYEAHGTWSVRADHHAQVLEAEGYIMQDMAVGGLFLVEALVFGLPVYVSTSEGEAPSETEFQVLVANGNVLELLLYYDLGFGATLAQLAGLPAASHQGDFGGLVAAHAIDGRLAATLEGGATVVFASVPAPAGL